MVEGITDVGEAAMDFGTFAYMMEAKYGGTTPAATGVDATATGDNMDYTRSGLDLSSSGVYERTGVGVQFNPFE